MPAPIQLRLPPLPAESSDAQSDSPRPSDFPATHWTLVAQLRGGEVESRRALETLCRNYWFPIYAALRRSGSSPHDAEDLTQGFFADLLREETLLDAEAKRGRLRNFLLGALRRFVAETTRHRLAQKRGGDTVILSLDWHQADLRYAEEPVDDSDPEKIYFRAWVRSLVDRVRQKMSAAYAGRESLYAALVPYVEGEETCPSFRDLGTLLGQTESGARVTVFRLRQRFREMLTEAVRQTVDTPSEVPEELAWVQATLAERRSR